MTCHSRKSETEFGKLCYGSDMTPNLEITSEQINDVPLLLGIMADMGIRELLDDDVRPHGAWQGISVGTLVSVWLCYLLTEQDHRLVRVRDWVAGRRETFNALLGIELRETDCTDDRLANVLTMLGAPATQERLDAALMQHWVRVYALPRETVRLDSTSVSVYQAADDAESLVQYGHSKDYRPDLAQFKVMLATLDPMGLPITCQVVGGQRADDGLYRPAYAAVTETLGTRAVLVVGDSKMGSLATRGTIMAQGSCYLCPYHPVNHPAERTAWIEQALTRAANWQTVWTEDTPPDQREAVAVVDEWTRAQEWTDDQGQVWAWTERVLVTRSHAAQQGAVRQQRQALARLCQRLVPFCQPPTRGRKLYRTVEDLRTKVAACLAQSDLATCLQLDFEEEPLPNGSTRWVLAFAVDWQAWQRRVARLGWQVYVTNTTPDQYATPTLVWAYRHQVIPERTFARLKTRHLNIRPLFIRDEQRIVGLTWILMLALRVLTLTEFRLRHALAQTGQALAGLNPAARSQTTRRPTTERVLQAFGNLTLTLIHNKGHPQRHVPPLTETQQHVLALLLLPPDLYARLADHHPNPLDHLRE